MGRTAPGQGAAATRSAWLHALFVVPVALLTVTVVPLGPWRPVVEGCVYCLGLAAAVVAVRRHHTPLALSWWGIAGAMVLFTLSSALQVPEQAGVDLGPLAGLHGDLVLAAYAVVVLAGLAAVRGGSGRRNWVAWADTASILLAAGLAVVAFVGSGTTFAPGFTAMGIGVPLILAVVLLVCFPLVASSAARSVSTMALLAAGVLAVTGYIGRIVAGPMAYMLLLDPLPLLAIGALVLAGRHPSVARMGARSAQHEAPTDRFLGIGVALLISPTLVLLWSIRHGGTGYVLGLGTAVLTGVALWRLTRLSRDRERTRAAVSAAELRLRLLLENATDVIGIIDRDGTIGYLSPAVQTLLGRPAETYVGRSALDMVDAQDRVRLRGGIPAADAPTGTEPTAIDVRLRHADGSSRWAELRISGHVTAAGIDGWVINVREVTDRKLFEDELRRQASTDSLTGVHNRKAFLDLLGTAAAGLDPASPPGVLFVDVDDFKAVNDSRGHAAGDEMLVAIARRLAGCVRTDDVVARLGGDEFALLLPATTPDELGDVADRVLAALRTPLRLTSGAVTVTVSVGGALGAPGCTAEALLQCADTAMYAAKRAGKNASTLLDMAQAELVP